eukprot:6200505-Pleurochrysis_carterae.AAC.1
MKPKCLDMSCRCDKLSARRRISSPRDVPMYSYSSRANFHNFSTKLRKANIAIGVPKYTPSGKAEATSASRTSR